MTLQTGDKVLVKIIQKGSRKNAFLIGRGKILKKLVGGTSLVKVYGLKGNIGVRTLNLTKI